MPQAVRPRGGVHGQASRRVLARFSIGRSALVLVLALAVGAVSLVALAAQSASEGPDIAAYWRLPLASQGEPPKLWSSQEQSLSPSDCGQCHAEQYQYWRQSRHAHAFSPGVVGQLLTYDAAAAAQCMQCHAPLAEQRAAFETARAAGTGNQRDGQGLAADGNACGGCHLRQYHRFGPPQRVTGAVGPSELPAPHGGVMRTPLFETSEFCSACHQFPAEWAINGKPLQNTYAEWKVSPQAARGDTCQSCHMPDRRHAWRGIHDPAMVAAGLTVRSSVNDRGARLEVTNTGTGHAFPTYTVPRIFLRAVALDGDGRPRPETARSYLIAREVRARSGQVSEISNTRLDPGQSAAVEIDWNGSNRARVWVEVIPDFHYETTVYPALLDSLPPGGDAAALIAQAAREAAANHFNLFETELQRP
jgi:hypothetical protein